MAKQSKNKITGITGGTIQTKNKSNMMDTVDLFIDPITNKKNKKITVNSDLVRTYDHLKKKDQKKYLEGFTTKERKKLLVALENQRKQDAISTKKYLANKKINDSLNSEKYRMDGNKATSIISKNSSLHAIEGLPYQFNKIVDPRIEGTVIGRKYAEKIYSRMPLVFLTPCDRMFMDDFNEKDRSNVLNFLISENVEGFSEDLLKDKGKYFSVKYNYNEYYNYLNPMLTAMATFLGLGNVEISIGGEKPEQLGRKDWSKEANKAFDNYFSAKENLVFYADSLNNISESFGNDTMESSLAGTINGFSDTAKELRFLINKGVAGTLTENATEAVSSITNSLSSITSKLGGGLVGSVTKNGINTVVNGGKILFPKLWADSSHSTSYSINFKFRSPDNDNLSIFMNILKPYAKLLALVMPKMEDSKSAGYDPNGYNSPHLVKATCPGFFHIDMGLITSMSVSKGEEGQWNDDGLPTVLDVSIEIEDLYNSVLYMSGYKSNTLNVFHVLTDPLKFISNTAYMDFLANTCGVNIHTPHFERMLSIVQSLIENSATTIPSRISTSFDQAITNLIGKAYRKIGL